MKKVEIYTTKTCGFCERAKDIFNKNGIMYKEIDATDSREEMMTRAGGASTVPQIFVDGTLIPGGAENVMDLEESGQLQSVFS